MESSAAEKSVCSRPYLPLLLFHKHKANILLRLFKMCMNNIAEKSSKLHRPEKCGRCRRCRCFIGSVCSRTVLSTFKRAAHTPKHKHVHGKLSHTSTETHTHIPLLGGIIMLRRCSGLLMDPWLRRSAWPLCVCSV